MRILIVSNRLPINVKEKDGMLLFEESVGGLTSGIKSYIESAKAKKDELEFVWVGWPGADIKKSRRKEVESHLVKRFHAHPVFMEEDMIDDFYHGFCNRTLWPLFHYFPSFTKYSKKQWESYKQANLLFCEKIIEIAKPDDIIWVHDYHLMLVPKMLREREKDNRIGFFLHIPFPSFEIYRLLPKECREEIIDGLMGSDLVGFHTNEYTQYFLRSILRIKGCESEMGKVIHENRTMKADTFPMGIAYDKWQELAELEEVKEEADKVNKKLGDVKIILSADRLDYSKGIVNRLKAFELFLEKNPEWHEKVTFVAVVVPSRTGVYNYRKMKREIDQTIGNINGKFGKVHWTPIIYQYKALDQIKLSGLYRSSDVMLVTPIRDGMNLMAKEYLACQTDGLGVLILSEMAGAAKELGESIVVNPNDISGMAESIKEALEMTEEEQKQRNKIMQIRLRRYDVTRWADDFVTALVRFREEQKKLKSRIATRDDLKDTSASFHKAEKRLILLDYDGTLMPFSKKPHQAYPSREVLTVLEKLSSDERNDVVIISGRDKDTLQDWLGNLNLTLIAEHGAWTKRPGSKWEASEKKMPEWKEHILSMLEVHSDRLPRSHVEEKEFSLVLHYRESDPEQSAIRIKELADELISLTSNKGINVIQGSKNIEVRSSGINKGIAASKIISAGEYDFIFSAGDDTTDEDLFKILPKDAHTYRVGMSQTNARFNLNSQEEVLSILKDMAE